MTSPLPQIVSLDVEASDVSRYDNHPVAFTNNHVVRIATMTEPYVWHHHPNSDETFLVLQGRLAIDFDEGELELGPGQMLTVTRGRRHRTRPIGAAPSTSPWSSLPPKPL